MPTQMHLKTAEKVARGSLRVVCGANGSGKTTLLREYLRRGQVSRLESLSGGDIGDHCLHDIAYAPKTIDPENAAGEPGKGQARKRSLLATLGSRTTTSASERSWADKNARDVAAYVDPLPLSRDLTVLEHLNLVAASWDGHGNSGSLGTGNTSSARHTSQQQTVQNVLADFRIQDLQNRLPHQVSLGQGQLINLALTFVRPAKHIVLDEPERHLDTEHTEVLAHLISQRASTGTSFLIATHSPQIIGLATNLIEL